MNKKFLVSLGIGAIALLYLFNVSYAVDNYGIEKSSVSLSVFADGSSGSSGSSGGSSGGGDVNVITCYSTFRLTLINDTIPEPLWAITDCNGCEPVECYEYRDQGKCTKSGGAGCYLCGL